MVICLMGPTASGKTRLAIELTQRLPCQIISVDSAMVYRGMDIGTAKPSREEQSIAPHRLIDIRDPAESYSVGLFCHDVQQEIRQIRQQGQIPLLVGGTMLYFWALQQGLAELPTGDTQIRQEIEQRAEREGWMALHQQLQAIDPKAAAYIHPHDRQRIQRALEVYQLTGKLFSEYQQGNHGQTEEAVTQDRSLNIILAPTLRSRLHERIAQRLNDMLSKGFIDEVAELKQRADLHQDLPAMRMVGYRQVWEYLNGDYDETVLRDRILFATRQFAKRQLTWLQRWQSALRIDSDHEQQLNQVMQWIEKHHG